MVKHSNHPHKAWVKEPIAAALAAWKQERQQLEAARQRARKLAADIRAEQFKEGNTSTWAGRPTRTDETPLMEALVLQHMPSFLRIQDQTFKAMGAAASSKHV